MSEQSINYVLNLIKNDQIQLTQEQKDDLMDIKHAATVFAEVVTANIQNNHKELTVALRKILEAKQAAVTAYTSQFIKD